MPKTARAGVDVGGTFTDFVFIDTDGQIKVAKCPSTPGDPSESVLRGLTEARTEARIIPGFDLIHGTTVATNALLERRGAKTALLTTIGFRDILIIGRQARESLYTFHPTKPRPLIPRENCFEVRERLDWRGEVLTPLDEHQVETLLDTLKSEKFESLAICCLYSFLYAQHERSISEKAQRHGFHVSLSSDIAPEPREYERACTTVANAFVAPIMARYLGRLAGRLREVQAGTLRIMQSDGGALSAGEAASHAVKTALSGPAGGVVAAAQIGELAGLPRLMTFDMGGTSTDVALIQNGELPIVTTATLGGMPLRTPMLDIHTVGAGGGSLARIDIGGSLRVGPQSAGADPGPVAYGKGTGLTVTDANLFLGRLPADIRLAGFLPLDRERVATHFAAFAAELGCSPEEAALGVVRVANAAMSRALRHISVERGHDPADFTLLSFGGAGGLHACALAESLGMRFVLVPRYPGAFSALGLALADIRREYVRALPVTGVSDGNARETEAAFAEIYHGLLALAEKEMRQEGVSPDALQIQRLINLRYVGQSFDLRIPYHAEGLSATIAAFHEAHRQRYGHADPREPVEAVAVRLVATSPGEPLDLHAEMPDTPGSPVGETEIVFDTGPHRVAVFLREHLAAGQTFSGPALILQSDATTLLPPDWQAKSDAFGNLLISRN